MGIKKLQVGGEMKLGPMFFVLFITMSSSFVGVVARDLNENETVDLCSRKASVAQYAMMHRDTISMEKMFEDLEHDWNKIGMLPHLSHVTYVDMQRIIRDALRTDSGGNYRLPNDKEGRERFIKREIHDCIAYGF